MFVVIDALDECNDREELLRFNLGVVKIRFSIKLASSESQRERYSTGAAFVTANRIDRKKYS
jgi:ribosomal protein L33